MRAWHTALIAAALAAASPVDALGQAQDAPPRPREAPPGQGESLDRRVEIVNDTDVAMVEFYATNVGVDGWGRDHLGDRVLEARGRITLDFEDGSGACWFDFKAVFDDGDVVVRRNFNVCKETGWRVFERKPGERPPGEAGQRI